MPCRHLSGFVYLSAVYDRVDIQNTGLFYHMFARKLQIGFFALMKLVTCETVAVSLRKIHQLLAVIRPYGHILYI